MAYKYEDDGIADLSFVVEDNLTNQFDATDFIF